MRDSFMFMLTTFFAPRMLFSKCTTCQTRSMLLIRRHYFMARERQIYCTSVYKLLPLLLAQLFHVHDSLNAVLDTFIYWHHMPKGAAHASFLPFHCCPAKCLSVENISSTRDQEPPVPVLLGTERWCMRILPAVPLLPSAVARTISLSKALSGGTHSPAHVRVSMAHQRCLAHDRGLPLSSVHLQTHIA